MATGRRDEQRLLDQSERDLVARTRHPQVTAESDGDLSQLVALLRERRDRARSIANRRRGAARRGQGADEGENSGMRQKAGVLAGALSRLNKERTRRDAQTRRNRQTHYARRALDLKRAAGEPDRPDPGQTPNLGLNPVENERAPTIGSPAEAGRVSQFVRNAQGERDARG